MLTWMSRAPTSAHAASSWCGRSELTGIEMSGSRALGPLLDDADGVDHGARAKPFDQLARVTGAGREVVERAGEGGARGRGAVADGEVDLPLVAGESPHDLVAEHPRAAKDEHRSAIRVRHRESCYVDRADVRQSL